MKKNYKTEEKQRKFVIFIRKIMEKILYVKLKLISSLMIFYPKKKNNKNF